MRKIGLSIILFFNSITPRTEIWLLIIFFFNSLTPIRGSIHSTTPPPLPRLPIPSARQLTWQSSGMSMFLHFGINTFTDSEWGTGHVDPSVFDPDTLDATQWVRVAKEAGFRRVILTAKHHDGFCLWPSAYTNYSVKSSSWKNGEGDVVADVAEAARVAGIGLGLYLSPWDRHEPCYGDSVRYNEYYLAQMRELLTNYGPIEEVWLDGAKGENATFMEYYFEEWFEIIRQLQPGAVIFSDAGPDVRWVGDEAGIASDTCWSMFNSSDVTIGGDFDMRYSRQGDAYGCNWVPPECDVSIRPGWFWHGSEHPKTANTLMEIFYESVGRNCKLLLNVPPNSTGLLVDEDVQVLYGFRDILKSIFSINFARDATVTAISVRGNDSQFEPSQILIDDLLTYWAPEEGQAKWYLHLDLGYPVAFNVLCIHEAIQLGQRVSQFHLDVLQDGVWFTVLNGTTIGYKKLERFDVVRSQFLRLIIDEARADPLIGYFGLYMDNTISVYMSNSSKIISNSEHTLKKNNYTALGSKIRPVSGNLTTNSIETS